MARRFFALEWNGTSTMQSAVTRANVPKMTMPYRSFALLYDALLGNAMFPLIRRNFEWVVRRYGIRFRSAADVACGTGAFVRYLCQWGIPVVGVDRAMAMLRIAIQKNGENGARFLRQDLRQLQLPYPVDLITCHFDSLNYLLSTRDLFMALCRFRANLTKGGYAIFDMVTDVSPEPKQGVRVQRFNLPCSLFDLGDRSGSGTPTAGRHDAQFLRHRRGEVSA